MKSAFLIPLILAGNSFALAKDLVCERDQVKENLGSIADTLKSEELNLCRPPAVGQTREIHVSSEDSLTTVPQNYRIRTVAKNKFEIVLNPVFVRQGQNDEALNRKWRKISKDCLQKTEGKVFGPRGESINFKLNSDPSMRADLVEVKEAGGRANSKNWTEDMTSKCDVVFHELMHLTGLVDEYVEIDPAKIVKMVTTTEGSATASSMQEVDDDSGKTLYDCRKIYDGDSIMKEQDAKWRKSFAPYDVTSFSCDCVNSGLCDEYNKKATALIEFKVDSSKTPPKEMSLPLKPSTCPAGFKGNKESLHTRKNVYKDKEEGLPFRTEGPMTSGAPIKAIPVIESYRPASEKLSLLEARHIDAILYPGCMAKNREYYENAANSYRTSVSNNGIGCLDYSWAKK